MDIQVRRVKKSSNEPKELPGFRAESELPEKSLAEISEQDMSEAFNESGSSSTDPTDLTLERDKEDNVSAGTTPPQRPYQMKQAKKSSKKQIAILLSMLGLVVVGAGGFFAYNEFLANKENVAPNIVAGETGKKEPKAELKPAPITGRDVAPEIASRPVTAVMIENSTVARPQAGLLDADMIVEAVAEGGITRFVALFQEGQPAHIGPIRSARPYYVEIAKTFDAAYVHAGGSDDALGLITSLGVKDMSAFENNGTYERVDYRDAPHDLYSSMQKLDERRTALGFTTSTFTPWKHKNDTAQTASAGNIDFSISGPQFNASYLYEPTSNSYLRLTAGQIHTDEKSGKQLNPKVVIALITSKGQDGQYSTYRLTGNGSMVVFQDGIVSTGTWSKESASTNFVFKDKNGLEFVFNKGQKWFTLLDSEGDVTYTPLATATP